MSILNHTGFISANEAFAAKGEEIFSKPQAGVFREFTDVMPLKAAELTIASFGATPGPRELLGTRVAASARFMSVTEQVKDYYTPKLQLKRIAVDGDANGAMAGLLTRYLGDAGPQFWDRLVSEFLLSNPVGIDGVSLLSDSHPHGSAGAVWDNLTTDALSFASFRAGINAMTGLVDEYGGPLNVRPTHLMVGPALESTALEVLNVMRVGTYSNTGAEATTGVVAAAALPNVLAGRGIQVLVNPYMTDADEWLLMDLSKSSKPIMLGEQSAPRAVALTDDRDVGVVERGEYEYFVHGAAAIVGAFPHLVYGRLD